MANLKKKQLKRFRLKHNKNGRKDSKMCLVIYKFFTV